MGGQGQRARPKTPPHDQKSDKGQEKMNKPEAPKATGAPVPNSAEGKDSEMKDANEETGEQGQASNTDVPMEVSIWKDKLCPITVQPKLFCNE